MLNRLRPGRPEDPQHTQHAVRALISAGYASHEAGRVFVRYRTHLRAAIASWAATAIAGFLTALIPALVLVVLGAATTGLLLCVFGIGLAAIERWRWRRERVHKEFSVQPRDQQYFLHQGVLWIALLAAQALLRPEHAGAIVGLGLVFGLPLSFVFRSYFYRSYPKLLAIVSNAPTGEVARDIVEGEIAASDEISLRAKQRSDSEPGAPGWARTFGRRRHVGIFLSGLVGWWILVRWAGSQAVGMGEAQGPIAMLNHDPRIWDSDNAELLAPFSGDILVNVIGVATGAMVGYGVLSFYRRFIEY